MLAASVPYVSYPTSTTKTAGCTQRASLREPTGAKRRREVVDEFRRGHTHRIETVLNRAVRDGHREVRFPTPGFSAKDQAAALSHEIGRECRAEERQTDGRLHGEIEIVDRLEEGEVGTTHHACQARLL